MANATAFSTTPQRIPLAKETNRKSLAGSSLPVPHVSDQCWASEQDTVTRMCSTLVTSATRAYVSTPRVKHRQNIRVSSGMQTGAFKMLYFESRAQASPSEESKHL